MSASLSPGRPRQLAKHDFWVCLEGSFQRRLALELVAEQMTGTPEWSTQSVKGLLRAESEDKLRSLCLAEQDHWHPALRALETQT